MLLLNQILFYKVIWYIKWRTLSMPVCSGLYGPRGSRTHPKPKSGYPSGAAEVEHIQFFWDAARTENAQSSKRFIHGWVCKLQQLPTSTTRPKTFHFWNRVPFHFFGPKKPKSRPQSTFSISKNSIIFNDLQAGATEHK